MKADLSRALLDWYEIEARDLPWRRTQDPYAIWISEIMLQQTQVDTVLSYYQRFLERFPNLEALAKASVDDVLKAWEGLGYYRRAVNFHRAATIVQNEHSGAIPSTAAQLWQLPGIGPYTAAAIASIAFGEDVPVLDGNVIRVITRLFCIEGDVGKSATKTELLRTLESLVPPGEASAFNQALMDLGARICRPKNPACVSCPVRASCSALQSDRVLDFPHRGPRKAVPHRDVVAGAIWDGEPFAENSKLLIAQRKLHDMLGGLWELPGGGVEDGESFEEALHRELDEELAIQVEILEPMMTIQHTYSHFRMSLHVFHCRHTHGEPQPIDVADWTWARPSTLDQYAFPGADRKILEALKGQTTEDAEDAKRT